MFPGDATKVATSWNTLPLRHIAFLLLRVAIGIRRIVYPYEEPESQEAHSGYIPAGSNLLRRACLLSDLMRIWTPGLPR